MTRQQSKWRVANVDLQFPIEAGTNLSALGEMKELVRLVCLGREERQPESNPGLYWITSPAFYQLYNTPVIYRTTGR
jgi:hypothetical protein